MTSKEKITKAIKRTAIIGSLASLALVGCDPVDNTYTNREYGQVMHENGTVIQLTYNQRHRGDASGPVITGKGVGLSFADVTIPESYTVVIQSEKHGKIIRTDDDNDGERLWKNLMLGEDVDITYKDIYQVTYKCKFAAWGSECLPNTIQQVSKVPDGYKFVDAVAKDNSQNKTLSIPINSSIEIIKGNGETVKIDGGVKVILRKEDDKK
jgi:hypothetical protein